MGRRLKQFNIKYTELAAGLEVEFFDKFYDFLPADAKIIAFGTYENRADSWIRVECPDFPEVPEAGRIPEEDFSFEKPSAFQKYYNCDFETSNIGWNTYNRPVELPNFIVERGSELPKRKGIGGLTGCEFDKIVKDTLFNFTSQQELYQDMILYGTGVVKNDRQDAIDQLKDSGYPEHYKEFAAVTEDNRLKKTCIHEWKKYVGLTQVYNYCTKCDKKDTE